MARTAAKSTMAHRTRGLPEGFPALVPPPDPRPGFVRRARVAARHKVAVFLFLFLVPLPTGVAGWYLYARAQDQFTSTFGFVVHAESEGSSGIVSALPGLAAIAGPVSSDTDILNAYLTSQALVEQVDEALDLRSRWSAGWQADPVFSFDPDGGIEDLTRYWRRMVQVSYDAGAGLMEIEVRSFDPEMARQIALQVEAACTALINRISGIARDDRLEHARRELRLAEDRLSEARQALTAFRVGNRIVDPLADLEGEMGVIHELQQALAEELVSLELLRRTMESASGSSRRVEINDTRITQGERRIAVIRNRIAEERRTFGDAGGRRDLARLTGEYEKLRVDVEVAQEAHAVALSAYEATRATLDRQSRYLAGYSAPTLAEQAVHPRRLRLLSTLSAGLFLAWSVVMLVIYSLRDRF